MSWKSSTTQNSSSSTLPVPFLQLATAADETSNTNPPALPTSCWRLETEILEPTGLPFGSRPCSGVQHCIVSTNTARTQKERATSPQTAFQGVAQCMALHQPPRVQGAEQLLSQKHLSCCWPGQCVVLFTKTSPEQPNYCNYLF